MASIVSAGTTSATALNMSADTSGVLQLASNNGTVALTISTAQIVSFTNPPTSTGGGGVSTNTAFGTSALGSNTSGGFNTAFGYQAGSSNTTGAASITAFGYQAGKANTSGYVTAFGFVALAANTSGANNAAFGALALTTNSTGSFNTGIGDNALYYTTASNNTAVGYQAGYSGTTGVTNTYLGVQAGYSGTTSNANVGVGSYSLYTSTGGGNTGLGYAAGQFVTTGTLNTYVGYLSGNSMTSGSKNVILGSYSGNQGGLDIRTASNYIVLSDGDGNPNAWLGNKNGVKELRLATATAITNNSIASVSTLYSGAFNISFASAGQGVFELVLGCWLLNSGTGAYGTTMLVYHIGCWAGYPETAWAPQATLISSNGRNFTGPAPTVSVSTSVNGIVTVTITGTGDKYYSWNYRYMGYTQAS